MNLKMIIANELFCEIPLDFVGKNGTRHRQEYLEEITQVLSDEFKREIQKADGQVEYYYEVESRMKFMEFSDFEIRQFEVKIQSHRYLKSLRAKKL